MYRIISKILSAGFGISALYVLWLDLTATTSSSVSLGRFWFEHHTGSLQVSEAVISRYIDPCSLITMLNCKPFLWHPLISGLLQWPAALVFLLCSLLLLGLAYLGRKSTPARASTRDLRRN